MLGRIGTILRVLLSVALICAFVVVPNSSQKAKAACSSTSECSKQITDLQKQAQDNANKLSSSKKQASNLQDAISNLNDDISYTTTKIQNTEDQIAATTSIITSLSGDINQKFAELTDLTKRLNSSYTSLYELYQTSTLEVMLQSNSLSDAVTRAQYVQQVQTDLQKKVAVVTDVKKDLESKKTDQETAKASLVSLKADLQSSKDKLTGQKSQKDYLLSATQDQISDYIANAADINKRIAEVQRQLSVLIAKASWGTDIISANDGSWYYSQLSYPNTRLGNSPYTVAQYGCLVTSFAMVAKYYGHNVNPATLATNTSNFDRNGYLLVQPPNGSGLSSSSSSSINWSKVDSEVAAGHPVIVSIYLPSVGAINSDGSSHFIVIKGKVGSKYLMHDPIGDGRSYGISQVRSMKVVR